MRSPRDMEIIEIDITNACIHECSNCTRFCGHHEKPFFMSFDCFRKAVDSLDGFEGMVGIIGGEPTLHPEFERFADYIIEKRTHEKLNISWGPISDMQFHIDTTVDKGRTKKTKTVLLSSLSSSYYKNFESINETFGYQLLNDHSSESLHQALLMSRKELNIPDDEWIRKRDACWIQNTWSASITPKGAFFCEVAGSLDMLFDGSGGWEVERDWWKREPKDFEDQLHWCELCSGCLDVPKRLSHDERDDVTPYMYQRLKDVRSPKVLKNRVVVRNPEKYEQYKDPTFENGSEYIKAGEYIRISSENRNLFPKDIQIYDMSSWKFEIKKRKPRDWVIVLNTSENRCPTIENVREYFEGKIWNPGCLYAIDDVVYAFNMRGRSIRDVAEFPSCMNENIKDYYSNDKIVYLSTNDKLVPIIGGDTALMKERGSRDNKTLVVYGAGKVGESVVKSLVENGIEDFKIAVSGGFCKENLMGYKVYAIDDFESQKDNVLIIVAVSAIYYDEVLNELNRLGLLNYRFIV